MKFESVRQHSEEDCGAACLATVAKYYGRSFALNHIRSAVGTGSSGTTLLGLRRGAEALGFNARQVRATTEFIDKLNEAPLPAIIHWKGFHWVVLYGKQGKKYVISDPAVGIRYLTYQELMTGWLDGTMLILLPDDTRFFEQPEDKVGGFGRFLRRVWPYRYLLAEAIAINLAIGLLALALPMMMQLLTDEVLVRGDLQLLTTVAIAVIAVNLFRSTISLIQSFLIGHFSERLQLGLILDYGYKLLRLPLSYFDAHRSGEVVSRIADIRKVNTLVSQIVLGLPSQFFVAFVSLGLMLFYSWQLTLAFLTAFVAIAVVNLLFVPSLQQKTRCLIVEGTENQGFLVETFRGSLVLKTTQATPQAWEEYQRNFGRLANLSWGTMKVQLYSTTLTGLLSGVTTVGLLWLGGYFVIQRTLTIGQLLAFYALNNYVLDFLGSALGLVDEFMTAQVVIQRLSEVLDSTPEDNTQALKPQASILDNAEIICTHLTFHYAGKVDLLNDFNLTIPGGKVTALIGQSGCGKSSLAKLIAGLYELQSGNIRYGIYNQQDLSLEFLRQQVVLVPQEPHFWSRSILDNFRFSYPNITFEHIVKACQIVSADEFISELPDKYQTILGEFGANLSGGQKQRLAIARAIVTDPPILILDEATGSLDPVLEATVLDQLLHYRQGKTTILISHRPRVIHRADWVVMIEQGRLKLFGSPQELQQLPGEHLGFLIP
ncbi:ATP-binding cassette domain-containing protein [Scytonema sp. UIC 10036]|uniref:peptidase domain-containing ABC transporter n=1 Tax=Scytonema sp. UIC 10036 TaxID=2304196 RepID=UPI0012DA22B5|nr:peptidase domain-containing ABC transporter [Scytonema sp. UIC 10036]MUG96856.1 ATP-binding cassette domain-containing protein [Scytonema sp. UIC 10036]